MCWTTPIRVLLISDILHTLRYQLFALLVALAYHLLVYFGGRKCMFCIPGFDERCPARQPTGTTGLAHHTMITGFR